MPAVGPADEQRRGRAERLADRAALDQLPACFVGRAEERVGRAAEAEPALGRESDEAARVVNGRRKRFLRMDVLAVRERRAHHRRVGGRRCQVEDRVDLGICDQVVDRRHAQTVFRAERRRHLLVEVGARDDVEAVERRRPAHVVVRDHAAADDTDTGCPFTPRPSGSAARRRTSA